MRCKRPSVGPGLIGMLFALPALAQQQPIASVATEGVALRGAMSVERGRAFLANNGEVTAGDKPATLQLVRGGTLQICATTRLQIAKDTAPRTGGAPGDAGLMFSLDRGAFEAHYTPGAYSDVVLTPDLRLLISGPGQADLKLRVNPQGDTCVDNTGQNAPYVTATSLTEGGAYRVRPGQRVLFVHGSLGQVVDNEREPCGCPPSTPQPSIAANGGPSSTPADTAFPTAVSEGLQAPPTLSGSPPVVPAGEPHAQVSATLSSSTPPAPPPAAVQVPPPPTAAPAPMPPAPRRGFFGSIGHFFGKVFGAS